MESKAFFMGCKIRFILIEPKFIELIVTKTKHYLVSLDKPHTKWSKLKKWYYFLRHRSKASFVNFQNYLRPT